MIGIAFNLIKNFTYLKKLIKDLLVYHIMENNVLKLKVKFSVIMK